MRTNLTEYRDGVQWWPRFRLIMQVSKARLRWFCGQSSKLPYILHWMKVTWLLRTDPSTLLYTRLSPSSQPRVGEGRKREEKLKLELFFLIISGNWMADRWKLPRQHRLRTNIDTRSIVLSRDPCTTKIFLTENLNRVTSIITSESDITFSAYFDSFSSISIWGVQLMIH